MYLLTCDGSCCHVDQETNRVSDSLRKAVSAAKMDKEVQVVVTDCLGFCAQGPVVHVLPDDIFYTGVQPEDAQTIVEDHVVKGMPVRRLQYIEPTKEEIAMGTSKPLYKKQVRIALRNCGEINPEDINEYISIDGYQALAKAVTEMTPRDVVDLMKKSGLRGRGGAGFPLGLKWESAARTPSDQKYMICNADEGDPGAFMDRSILEGDPHNILEAMAIGGYAIGADTGYIYIRAEYPLAIKRLNIAIAQAKEYGLLGENILGTDFSFHIELKYGAGAFVCGEETALIHSIEGNRGEPTTKPPYPTQKGLWGKPSCVNNVETLANVPAIMLRGADWFNSIGSERSKGTKVFALAGKVNNVGLVEVPMGIKLRDIIYGIGGGIKDGKQFKAVQTGGPSGGCIPAEFLDLPIDYENLNRIGSMMGSGGMIVMDEDDCMVSIAKFYLEFTVDESCGKCTPCRIGNKRLHEILTKITEGKGTQEDLNKLKDLGEIIIDTALCGLGQSSPNPVLSTMKYFAEEYEAHVFDKKCPAGVCQALLSYTVIADKCRGCTACKRVCPVNAITGEIKAPHVIDLEKCIKCGACVDACKFDAIVRV